MRHVALLGVLLSLSGCAFLKESYSPSYKPRHTPGELADVGPIVVNLRGYRDSGGRAIYTLFLRGALPDCGRVTWVWPGGLEAHDQCGITRAESKTLFMACVGECSATVIVQDDTGHVIGRGSASILVPGATEP